MSYQLFFQIDYLVFCALTLIILFFLRKSVCGYLCKRYKRAFNCNTRGYYISVFCTLILGWAAAEYKGTLVDLNLRKELLFYAESVAQTINPERVEQLSFSPEDRDNPAFQRIREQMISYSSFYGGFRGIYSVAKKDGNIVFGPENYDLSDPMASNPGEIYQFPDEEMKLSLDDGRKRTMGPFSDEYGTFVSAYAPVFSKTTGEVIMLVGVDILADDWKMSVIAERASSMMRTFLIIIVFFVFFILVGIRGISSRSGLWYFRHLEAELIFVMGTALALIFGYNAYLLAKINHEGDNRKIAESRVAVIRQGFFELRRDLESISTLMSNVRFNQATFNKAVNAIARSSAVRSIQYAHIVNGTLSPLYNYPNENSIIEKNGLLLTSGTSEAMSQAEASGYSTVSRPVSISDGSSTFQLSFVFTPVFSDMHRNISGFIIAALDLERIMLSNRFGDVSGDSGISMSLINLSPGSMMEKDLSSDLRFFPLFVFGNTFAIEVKTDDPERFPTQIVPGIATVFFVFLLTVLFSMFIVFLRNREILLEIMVKNKTKELAESENDLMTTLYSIGDAVISTDALGIVKRMNAVAVDLTGFSVEEGVGRNVDEIFNIKNAVTGENIKCPVEDVILTRKAVELVNDTTLISKNGSERQIADSVAPIIDPGGGLKGTVLVFHDVTDQYRIKQQLVESNERFILAVDGSQDGIWDWNLRTNELFLSKRWKEMIGYGEDEVPGVIDSLERRIHPDDKLRVMKEMENYLSGRQKHYSCEFRLRNKNGSYIWVLARGEALFDESGRAYRMAGSHTDITERKLNEQAYIDARKEAEKATLAKSEFLANMSHEIRTPLNGIIGFSELLMRSKLDPIQAGYMSNISKSADVLLDVVNDVLDLSKIEAGKMELESENCDLHALLNESAELIRHKILDKPIKLEISIEKDVLHNVITDSLKLRQVVVNLLSNAAKFTERGMIELKAASVRKTADGREGIRISVSDTGIGIKPEQMEKLFKSFTQADPSTTRKYGGTGLGLVISNKILEKMGSRINVESRYQEGSVFWFEIDLVPGEYAGPPVDHAPSESPNDIFVSNRKFRILVAEDNEINMMLTKNVLDQALPASDVISASNGSEAVKLYLEYLPDLVFMDIQMPEMDGYSAAREIRSIEKGLNRRSPVVALTAGVIKDEKARCFECGMDDYITKPVTGSMIAAVLRKHLVENAGRKDSFDEEQLRNDIGDDQELFSKLIDTVRTEFPQKISALRISVENGDMKDALSSTHALKGSCLSMRFRRMAGIAKELESVIKSGSSKDIVMSVVTRLESEEEILMNIIRDV